MSKRSQRHANVAQSTHTPALRQETTEAPTSGGTKLLLTPQEAANALRTSRTTIYKLIKRGEIPSLKIGQLRRIPLKALKEWVASQTDA